MSEIKKFKCRLCERLGCPPLAFIARKKTNLIAWHMGRARYHDESGDTAEALQHRLEAKRLRMESENE